jgi:hypothetical protein
MTTGTVAYGHATSKPVELTCRYQLEIGESFERWRLIRTWHHTSCIVVPISPITELNVWSLFSYNTIDLDYNNAISASTDIQVVWGCFASLGRVKIVLQPCNHDPATGEEVAKQREFNPRGTRQIHPMPDDGISAEAYLLSDPRTIQRSAKSDPASTFELLIELSLNEHGLWSNFSTLRS